MGTGLLLEALPLFIGKDGHDYSLIPLTLTLSQKGEGIKICEKCI